MIVYFDTSVLVAYYTIEERTDDARTIVEQATQPVLSDLSIAEFNVAVSRKRLEGFLSAPAAEAVFSLFDEHVREIFLRVALDEGHVAATRHLSERTGISLRALDALHLAVALDVEGAVASFDNRMVAAARALDFEIMPIDSKQ